MRILSRGMTKSHISGLILAVGVAGCYGHAHQAGAPRPPKDLKLPMVSVPPGDFTMGDRNGEPAEYPERAITLSGFMIDKTEVSNAAYAECVTANVCDPAPYVEDERLGHPEHPVVGVTWHDAVRFCKWMDKRLPTEAEWEYAAKGKDHRKWPWSGAFDAKRSNTVMQGDFHGKTAPVTAYPNGVSPYGALNMAGNASEWVADYFDPTWYRTSDAKRDPTGPKRGRERVVRGGSYRDSSHAARVSARSAKGETESDSTIGFRCAK